MKQSLYSCVTLNIQGMIHISVFSTTSNPLSFRFCTSYCILTAFSSHFSQYYLANFLSLWDQYQCHFLKGTLLITLSMQQPIPLGIPNQILNYSQRLQSCFTFWLNSCCSGFSSVKWIIIVSNLQGCCEDLLQSPPYNITIK